MKRKFAFALGGALVAQTASWADTLTEPPADAASGIAVSAEQPDHSVANGILYVPRVLAQLILTAPRYAAIGVDHYLESRSPNAFGRDVHSSWRLGIQFDYERITGASGAARVGYGFGKDLAIDAYGGGFGARGQSGGARLSLGRYTSWRIQPAIDGMIGRNMERVFAGIGEVDGRRMTFDQKTAMTHAVVAVRPNDTWLIIARGGYATTTPTDDDVAATYPMIDIGVKDKAATGELSISYDTRSTYYPWIRPAAPSAGTLITASAAYTRGDADGTYDFGRGQLDVKQLFDLFHGDRVLTLAAHTETITADPMSVPFTQLPALGGADMLRAYARDQLRDRSATYGSIEYAWPVAAASSAFLFVESGEVHDGYRNFETSDLHLGYGAGFRAYEGRTTFMTLQVGAVDNDEVGAFVQVGAL